MAGKTANHYQAMELLKALKELSEWTIQAKQFIGSEDVGRLQSCLNITDGGDSLRINA